MKRGKLYRILAVAILLCLLLAVITPDTPVLAAPILNVLPASGAVGTKVTVTGENFDSYKGDDIYLFFNNQKVTISPITVPQTGSFSFDFNVPAGAEPGRHQITAKSGLGTLALSLFTVLKAGISLDRNSGVVGTKLTINGQGFYADRVVNLYYDNRMLGTEVAGGTGELSYSFTIPDSTAGKHKIVAKNAEGHSAEAEFEVLPSITLNPTSAAAGDILAVSGSGFGPRSRIDVYFKEDEVAYAKTDEFGNFKVALFNVPAMASGTYDVTAKDKDGNKGKTAFIVIAGARLDKTVAHVGDEVTISGTGFNVGGTITIKYDDVAITKIMADSNGAFRAVFRAPASKYGNHVITVSDGINTKQLAFAIESEAPPIPTPLLPSDGSKVKAEAYFDWEDVDDPSLPITYCFQVAPDRDFTAIVLEKRLTVSEYTLTKAEKLAAVKKESPYYWRVKAIDSAANESEWSEPNSFYVGFPFALPKWAIYTLIGVGALVIGFLAFRLGKRTAYYQT